MANDPSEREDEDGDLQTQQKRRVEKVRRYKVVLHNDNYTTQEFVVFVLKKFFHKNDAEATHIMLCVHHKGSGVAGVYPKDIAVTKVDAVQKLAREHGMPLRLTAEPE